MKKYELIKTEKYKLILLLDESEVDYYTNVYIKLIFGVNKITIFKDNLLELKNNMKQIVENIHILEDRLDETKLGMLLNDYYQEVYEGDFDENIILDSRDRWIGEKYCWFINCKYATWLYRYCERIIMKVTPVFYKFEEDDYVQEYCKFKQEYKDVFREQISLEQIIYMKELIFNLYDNIFGYLY